MANDSLIPVRFWKNHPDEEVRNFYGVLNDKGSAKRTTFLIDEDGKIINIWFKVNTKAHAEEVLQFIDENS